MPGDAFANILAKKDALKDAVANTDVGVKAKKAVEAKKADEAPPKADGKPSKYSIPRNPGESLGDFAARVAQAKKDAEK